MATSLGPCVAKYWPRRFVRFSLWRQREGNASHRRPVTRLGGIRVRLIAESTTIEKRSETTQVDYARNPELKDLLRKHNAT